MNTRIQGIPAFGEDPQIIILEAAMKDYEYHSACQMRSVVQIYADVHTTMSKPRKYKLVIEILLIFIILLNVFLNLCRH